MEPGQLEVVEPHAELVTMERDPEWAEKALRLIEECGRVSHKSEGRIRPGSAEPFVRKVAIEWGHESILEHASFTACFVGSRSMSHQLVRHRIAAYTQESQRFCDYAEEDDPRLKIIIPPSIGTPVPGSHVMFEEREDIEERIRRTRSTDPRLECSGLQIWGPGAPTCDVIHDGSLYSLLLEALTCYDAYRGMREDGIPAEDAREVLPNCTKTEVYATFNLREWRHVFRMRLDAHAQWQIKKVVREVFDHFRAVCPVLLEGLRTHSGEEMP